MNHSSLPPPPAEPDVEASLEWSWLTREDLSEIDDLRQATDYLDDPIERVDLADMIDSFEAPGADPTNNAVVGRDSSGSLVAYAWGHPRMGVDQARYWLDWNVHPGWRHRRITHAVIGWLCEQGMQWWESSGPEDQRLPLWLGTYVDEKLGLRVNGLTDHGFTPQRWLTDLSVEIGQVSSTHLAEQPPEGVRLVPLIPDLDEAVRRAHNDAMSTGGPDAQPVTSAVWAHILARSTTRRDWSHVALAGDQVVGYALNSGHHAEWDPQVLEEGWTDFLGTIPSWRMQGVARSLLIASLRSFREAGLITAGIGMNLVDHPLPRLFEDIGYVPGDRLILMARRHPQT